MNSGDLASASADLTIKIWDIRTGRITRTLTGHSDNVYALVLLENRDLGSGSEGNIIKILDFEDGSVKRTFNGHTEYVCSLMMMDID